MTKLSFSRSVLQLSPEVKMEIFSSNSFNHWLFFFKVALVSTGLLSMAMILKLSIPLVVAFISELPFFWSVLLSWLRPPYLYLIINGIIIGIVASSKLHRKLEDPAVTVMETVGERNRVDGPEDETAEIIVGNGCDLPRSCGFDANENVAAEEVLDGEVEKHPILEREEIKLEGDEIVKMMINEDEASLVIPPPASSGLLREDSMEFLFPIEKNKPPVSSRFAHRKAVKASPEAKPLGVSKPKRHDTLENTWKTITEGRSIPLSRHLKKSDTWENNSRRNPPADQNIPPTMKKAETFKDRNVTDGSTGSGKLRKEPSLSQDELNKRVEAFIRKFNEEMRLQRQASLNQYKEMIAGGAYLN